MKMLMNEKNRPIGQLHDQGSILVLCSVSGRRLGSYNKSMDITLDANGRQVGRGNILMMLLESGK